MPLYSVKVEAISPITNMPTSQTIFGTICHYYENEYGTASLEKMLENFDNNKPCFLISSMFFKNTFPVPHDFMPHLDKVSSRNDAVLTKGTKKIKYFSKKVFLMYQQDAQQFQSKYYEMLKSQNYIINNGILMLKEEENSNIVNFVKTTRTRTNVNEEQYFKDEVIVFDKNTTFEFYIEILDESITENLFNVLSKMKYINFGGFKSIGYNMFNVNEFELCDNLKAKQPKMLISLAIGDDSIDYNRSFYQIKQVNLKFNNSSDTVNRAKTIVFTEGSIICTTKPYIGKVIKEENNGKNTYQNVLGLLI